MISALCQANCSRKEKRLLCDFLRARQAAGELRPDAKVEAAVRLLSSGVRSLILLWGQETPETWHAVVEAFVRDELDVILQGIASARDEGIANRATPKPGDTE